MGRASAELITLWLNIWYGNSSVAFNQKTIIITLIEISTICNIHRLNYLIIIIVRANVRVACVVGCQDRTGGSLEGAT